MRTLKKIVFTGLFALIACAGVAQAQELYKDEKAPMHERIMDLLSRLTVEEKSACCVQPLRVFLVWIFPNITTVTKRFTEWFVRDALPFSRRLSDWRQPGTRNCNCRWLRLFLMRHVPLERTGSGTGTKKPV